MALDTDRYYGALGFEFHQNRLKKFKKGEVVLCMGVGNNYDLPFGWESPFIYSKFVHVFGEHFVATEEGRFSIDRIFKVDKEYRFYVPQIDMHFISYFRIEVIENGGLIHFNWIDKNPIKENFAIPIDAPADLIKTQLAYTKGIQLFELRKSSKVVATKKAKAVKPVIENKKSSSSSIIDYFGLQIYKNKERGEDRFHVICDVCERSVAPDHNRPTMFYGFRCQDTKMFVCLDCKPKYYENKNSGVYGKEHANKYSEMPVPVPSSNIPEVKHQGTEIFGSWYYHKRPHELKIVKSAVVVTWLDECQDNIETSIFNLFDTLTTPKVKEVDAWLLEQGFYQTNPDKNSEKLPVKPVKKKTEQVPFITGLNGCKCHPFASWKESDKAHKQKFEVGDQVINRCNKKVGFINSIGDHVGNYYTVKYGKNPSDIELKHAAELDILITVKSPLNKNFKPVATKSVKKDKPVIENNKSFQLPEDVVKTINKYVPKMDGVEMLPVKPVPVTSVDLDPKYKIENTAKRDKKAQKRDEIIKFRVTGEVKQLIQELAKHDDQDSVANLIKASIRKYALSSIKFKTPFDFSKLEIIK